MSSQARLILLSIADRIFWPNEMFAFDLTNNTAGTKVIDLLLERASNLIMYMIGTACLLQAGGGMPTVACD